MPKGMRGTTLAPPANDLLRPDPLDLASELSYPHILVEAGAYRVPGVGGMRVMHRLPIGAPYRVGKAWKQNTKAYPVAMSAEEARDKTRKTGERWDYFEPGAKCKQCAEVSGNPVISGWVLGGRKFQAEHAHVTDFDPAVYEAVDVDPPEMAEEDDMADAAPVPVEG